MSVKIFLSTVSDEFRAYRDQLRSDLTRHNVEVKVQEDFKDLGGDTLDKLDVYIADCDAVVHLVGDMTARIRASMRCARCAAKYPDLADKLPPLGEALQSGAGVSYTQWEAWLALYHGKLLVIAKAADSAERGPQYSSRQTARAPPRPHIWQRLKGMGRYPGCIFTSPDNLAKSVLSSAILDLLVENVIVQRSGSGADTDIQSGRPYLRLTQYVRRTKLAVRDSSETALLSAYRAESCRSSAATAKSASSTVAGRSGPVSIRVLVGAGGRGKTRLALELAREIAKDGWLAGFVDARTSSTDFAARAASSNGAGTSRSLSSSIMRRAAPSKCARGCANSWTRRSKTAKIAPAAARTPGEPRDRLARDDFRPRRQR